MNNDEHRLVLERLRELEGWSEYIAEALHLNQKSEPVKREMLERWLQKEGLREIRELCWSLRDRLHLMTTQLELSSSPEASMA